MTAEGERALLADYMATCARLHAGFNVSIEEVSASMPITAERIDTLPIMEESSVLAFLKRFEQFEDALNRTLKAISKIMEHGKIERLTSIDVTRRAFHLGILPSEKTWADAVRTRNTLAHEYPLDPHKRTEQVNAAWQSRTTLNQTFDAISAFIEREGLLR